MLRFPSQALATERLLLREIAHVDLDDLYAVHSVAAVNRYLPYTTWQSKADAEAWWQRVQDRMSDGKALQFAICLRDSQRVIGSCVLFAYDEAHGRIEIGYAFGQDYWGRGYAREALERFLDYCFDDLALRRIEARVDARNRASSGLLTRLGFVSEGCLRQWQMEGDTPVDSQLFALLAHERAGATR
ncbi:GNAT family N-acetyltransferase [Seongchinamella sediminis]|uniref:GNAT family N-acetyltransferase n=2 Tax=Seongchinamella sediminis TaxID=2283635 RepID=A0A3L7DWQ3_9GAMM|nr:GNAT family N-acetyltransferase [Seongchinamella sediminis]